MADDRIFIKCKACGGWKMLLKHFIGQGPQTRDNGILEWLDEHSQCHPKVLHTDLGGDPGFTLHTEDEICNGGSLDFEKQNFTPKNR